MAFCANCGKEMSDHAVACPNCGHPTGVSGAPIGGGVGNGGTAEWWKRLVAYLIDVVLLAIANNIMSRAFGFSGQAFVFSPASFTAPFFILFLVGAAVSFAYFGILNGSDKGQTVGKMVMKICVRDVATGGPIGTSRGVIRAVIPALGFLTCGILPLVDGLWPLWDPNGQALHDKMATSRVVDAL